MTREIQLVIPLFGNNLKLTTIFRFVLFYLFVCLLLLLLLFSFDNALGTLNELVGVIHAQYELQCYCLFRFSGEDSTRANDDDIGLHAIYRNIYHDSFAGTCVFSQIYDNIFLEKWLGRRKFSYFLLFSTAVNFQKFAVIRQTIIVVIENLLQ